ncbi:MAG: arginine--tRNA ligase [Thermoleophilaceae bacterium]
MADPVADLAAEVGAAASGLTDAAVEPPTLERPPKPEFGDYSTNAPMLLARPLGRPPRDIAADLGVALAERLGDSLVRTEVAGPGFVNLFMSDRWYAATLAEIVGAGAGYGKGRGRGRVNVEFVSANPTGPITVASARHAAYGDSLSRVLEMAGDRVEREYYVNDSGTQIERFAASIRARTDGEAPPKDGYQGEYVTVLAGQIAGAADMDDAELARRGVGLMLAGIERTLERFGVHMDRFVLESTLHDDGKVAAALQRLEERGETYRHDGATWLRTTAHGDDKDRVLVRSTGELTYFAADIANHEAKRERGSDLDIDVLGADHHGYVGRILAAWQSLGGEEGTLDAVILQLVNLQEAGVRAQMSKRAGAIVALDDLIDDIGVDATRWFLLQRSHETTIDLDLDLARRQSQDNPVYYAQYAHARIASILRKAGDDRVEHAMSADLAASTEQWHPSAQALVKRLSELPTEVDEAAARRAPHRMTTYVTELAQDFSGFYRDCKVVGAAEEGGDEDLRIALSEATRRVIARSLELLGVSAPAEM